MNTQPWTQVDCGPQRWWVDPSWSQQLLDDGGLRLKQWSDEGKIEIVKQSESRTVYRVGLPERPVYIKHYPVNNLKARAKQWVRQAKALTEWQRTIQLNERSVPTTTPVAVGQHPEQGSYIITEEIPESQSLLEYVESHWHRWQQRDDQHQSRQLIAEVSQFLARMLQNGISHDDLHAGNILIHSTAEGTREWYLIDPYAVQTQPPCDRKALRNTLALISHSFWHYLSPRQRLQAWAIFRRTSGYHFHRDEERSFLMELQKHLERQLYAQWNQRAKRNTKANRDFYELRVRRCNAWASRQVPANWLSRFLFDPEEWMASPAGEVFKASRHGRVVKLQAEHEAIVIKQFAARHALDRIIGRWRRSPALHCYRMAYRLQTAHIPISKPLAVVEQRRHGQLLHSYFFMEYLDNTQDLGAYWLQASNTARRQVSEQLARLIAQLHRYRMSHRDLKALNILVQPRGEASQIYLIDFRGVTHSWWLTHQRRCKDLARLAISAITTMQASRTDLLRFLLWYLSQDEQPRWRHYWKQIARYMQAKILQNLKRQRRLS
ncbi:MAG: lipopolysaccharide kinase InaA family protein [Gemmatales bacterium]